MLTLVGSHPSGVSRFAGFPVAGGGLHNVRKVCKSELEKHTILEDLSGRHAV